MRAEVVMSEYYEWKGGAEKTDIPKPWNTHRRVIWRERCRKRE